ncbi:MAG TPA: Holliday junction branch migration DNA helicase RuvB [Thermodesulforhabdus norvegica]|uniref:Holliday junction branch migration complex subunit RuvB n=1 Tax=Thermodesulforhabdus norvegica TaxID=39841 RepID=A0A7C0WV40_9BACT|nr:Holliday junction branch migration DNA helicase RuvB [Thermodesulforhabdus norvegica]
MIERDKQITSAKGQVADNKLDLALRPKTLDEYIGQADVKMNLDVSMKAAIKRKDPLEHLLFYGPPGLGKTTIANIIASEMGVSIKTTSGPAIEKQGDLASILTNLKENDILFIDEIHRLKTNIEEILYSAMEDYALDIIIGKGPAARSMRLDLPRFTLIGATTKIGTLSAPLRDRFGHVHKLDFYSDAEIQQILKRSAGLLEMDVENSALAEIAKCSRRTPRVANRLLKRVRDFATVGDVNPINLKFAQECLSTIGVDILGLNKTDRQILLTIIEKFQGGPVGVNAIAAATSEESETIEDLYEPYLLQIGFLDRTRQGRVVTENAYLHLEINMPTPKVGQAKNKNVEQKNLF